MKLYVVSSVAKAGEKLSAAITAIVKAFLLFPLLFPNSEQTT